MTGPCATVCTRCGQYRTDGRDGPVACACPPDEPDCTSCNDTGWVSVGFEFDGTGITAPCPACGAGDDVLGALRSSLP